MPLDGGTFNFRDPDYVEAFEGRLEALGRIRRARAAFWAREKAKLLTPGELDPLVLLKAHYRSQGGAGIANFISDWGCTSDPRNVELGLPAVIPFVLMPRQEDLVEFVFDCWKSRQRGAIDKSRDTGVTWLLMCMSATMCLFYEGMRVGCGSRKEEYVDLLGDPKSMFHKAREFLRLLPSEFRGGYEPAKHSFHRRITIPDMDAMISGEAGDNIGRGDRTGLYLVDEAPYIEHPQLVDNSLSQTTNCQIDIGTAPPDGMANHFSIKVHSGRVRRFTYHWRDDKRKDDAWYTKQCEELDAVTVAQEIDIDYQASAEGVIIPNAWARAAVGACEVLKIKPTGDTFAALDIADGGKDQNACVVAKGCEVLFALEWSGKDSNTFLTVEKAVGICDQFATRKLRYDADGLGALVKGDVFAINRDGRKGLRPIDAEAFRGSAGVFQPEREDVKGRKNEDYFMNLKAQMWWRLRILFLNTHRWVVEGKPPKDRDAIISISKALPVAVREKLIVQLSQPKFTVGNAGKVVVDKDPDDVKSPDLGDAVMIRFAMQRAKMRIAAGAAESM